MAYALNGGVVEVGVTTRLKHPYIRNATVIATAI